MSEQDQNNHYSESFFRQCDENADIPPYQLSGDQSSETVVVSFAAASKANFVLSVTTIMKTVIGAGILSLPFTMSRLGYVMALLVFILILVVNQITCIALLKAKNLSRHSNYTSISYHIFRSRVFQALISVFILFNNLGICIVELTIFKETVHKLLGDYIDDKELLDQFYMSQIFIVLVFSILLAPFTAVKKIQKLKFMAFLGVGGITIFVISFLINFVGEMSQRHWKNSFTLDAFPRDWTRAMSVLPNIMLAFAYQMNFFPIFKGMKDASDTKMSRASITGLGGCCLFYILVATCGYVLYGYDDIQANFLLALKKQDLNPILFVIINAGFLCSVFFSFPVMFFGARNNFIALIKMIKMSSKSIKGPWASVNNDGVEQISSFMEETNIQNKKRNAAILFYSLTIFLFLLSIAITIAVQSIEEVFNLVGAVASNALGFLFPSLFYFVIIAKKKKPKGIYFFLTVAIFGFFIPLGLLSIVFQYVDP